MLNAAGLLSDLGNLIAGTGGFPSTTTEAGQDWGNAYGDYALTGTANAVPAVEGPGARATLATGLAGAFAGAGAPAVTTAFVATLDAYWTAMVFAGQVGTPIPVGNPVLQVALLDILDGPNRDNPTAAAALRDALHTYTGAVTVTFPGPVTFTVV